MSTEYLPVADDNDDLKPVRHANIDRRQNMAVGQAMGVQEILAQVKLIQEVMRSVMVEGEHFGVVPGCGTRKTLLQPGAQKLTMTFRLAPEYQIQETDLSNGHKEYRVICTLKNLGSGSFVGQGVGCCSTMESKYRWRGGSRKCPNCGKETIIKGKEEYGGGWLCFAKKGGCGAKWPDGAQEIESQSIERVEHENPADFYNTVLKMSKKRAFVDATITATAASDIFTQDIGDEDDSSPAAEKAPAPKPPPPKTAAKPVDPDAVAKWDKIRLKLLNRLNAAPGQPAREFIKDYLVSRAWIKPHQEPEDWPTAHIPTTEDKAAELFSNIQMFERRRNEQALTEEQV